MEAVAALLGPGVDRLFHLEEAFARTTRPSRCTTANSCRPCRLQGRGIGSAFLRDMLQRADADELPAYHEATSPRNRVLYERYGYVSLGELVLPDGGPTVWRMWRDPR